MKTKLFLLIIGLAIGVVIGLYFTHFSSMLMEQQHEETTINYQQENNFLSDLIEGHEDFKEHYYPLHEKEYLELVDKGQKPGAIMLTCSDSRISIEHLFSTNPGQIFVVRNPGNLAPPYTTNTSELQSSVLASIEYGLKVLGIRDIIVMGHSDCGAMKAIYSQTNLSGLPGLKRWLYEDNTLFSKFKQKYQNNPSIQKQGLFLFEKFSVVGQLYHISKYPIVKEMLDKQSINLHGWFYDLRSGDVDYYDPQKKGFFPLSLKKSGKKPQLKHTHAKNN